MINKDKLEVLLVSRIENCEKDEKIATKIMSDNAEKRYKWQDAKDRYNHANTALVYATAQKDAYEDILGCITDEIYQ